MLAKFFLTFAAFGLFFLAGPAARGQEPVDKMQIAPVIVDGDSLFYVSGVEAYPAKRRAREIRDRIITLAKDPNFSPDSLTLQEEGKSVKVMAGDLAIVTIFEWDARRQEVSMDVASQVALRKIKETILDYREFRRPEVLKKGIFLSIGAILLLVILFFLFHRIFSKLRAYLHRRYLSRMQTFKVGSVEVIRTERLLNVFTILIQTARFLVFFVLFYVFLDFVLVRFPGTRGVAKQLMSWVLGPLESIGLSILEYLPDFFFLLVLIAIAIFSLRLLRLLFLGLEQGTIEFAGFDREWARPTFNLVRVLVIVFFLVVAYPYIPGSESEAFKGISIFLGLIFSLGSSSAISNLIAGYTMIYRGTFKVGDRIQVGDHTGDVTACRLLTTQIQTVKNERVVVPNSLILGSSVVNYSALAKERGLILHSTVGIGYETPWRQVEAMLKLAADRTPGLLKAPPPFVLQRALGDFAVSYEINAYCQDPQRMGFLYSDLHRNILDLFNEHGVQIMTPAYEGDPEEPKVVPKDQWYESPAQAPVPQKSE